MKTEQAYVVGDRVRHTARFLRSIGWYTNVPDYGVVVGHKASGLPVVRWQGDDRADDELPGILPVNIILKSKMDWSAS